MQLIDCSQVTTNLLSSMSPRHVSVLLKLNYGVTELLCYVVIESVKFFKLSLHVFA